MNHFSPSTRLVIVFSLLCFLFCSCTSDTKKVDKLLDQANQAFEAEEYSKAKIHLKNAIKIDPQRAAAHSLLARTHLALDETREAFSAYIKLSRLQPDNIEPKIRLATFYLMGNQVEEAQKMVDSVLEMAPGNVEALYLRAALLAREKADIRDIIEVYRSIIDKDTTQTRAYASLYRIYLESRDASAAKAVLDELMKNQPDSPEPLLILGDYHARMNNMALAEKAFASAIDKDPKRAGSHMAAARFYSRTGRQEKAESHIKQARALEPENIDIIRAYADFHFAHKNFDPALKLVETILEKRPAFSPAILLKGKILASVKEYDQAIAIFSDLVKNEPGSAEFHYLLATACYGNGMFDRARQSFLKTLELDPRLSKARILLANIYFNDKDYDLARTQVEKILEETPEDYNANILMGRLLMTDNELDRAASIFNEMVLKQPENPVAHFHSGVIHRLEKEYDQALKSLNRALELNPGLVDVFSHIIGIYAARKQYDTAIERCDKHLEIVEDIPVVRSVILTLKGNLLLAKNDREQAAEAFSKAIEYNPEFISPYISLSALLNAQGKTDETIRVYQELIEKRPDQPSGSSLLGILYESRKEYDKAKEMYSKALEIDPGFIPALNNLAFLYATQGEQLNRALELARQAREKAGDIPAVMDTLGWVYYKKGLFDMAVSEFESCIKKEPDNPVFQYHLGLALLEKGEKQTAQKALETALSLDPDPETAGEIQRVLEDI